MVRKGKLQTLDPGKLIQIDSFHVNQELRSSDTYQPFDGVEKRAPTLRLL